MMPVICTVRYGAAPFMGPPGGSDGRADRWRPGRGVTMLRSSRRPAWPRNRRGSGSSTRRRPWRVCFSSRRSSSVPIRHPLRSPHPRSSDDRTCHRRPSSRARAPRPGWCTRPTGRARAAPGMGRVPVRHRRTRPGTDPVRLPERPREPRRPRAPDDPSRACGGSGEDAGDAPRRDPLPRGWTRIW